MRKKRILGLCKGRDRWLGAFTRPSWAAAGALVAVEVGAGNDPTGANLAAELKGLVAA